MSRNPSKYSKNMARLSAQIFGEALPEHEKKSRKVIELLSRKPIKYNRQITQYYPPLHEINNMMKDLRRLGLYM